MKTPATAWAAIASRAHDAEGPDRELDAAVAEAMGHGIEWRQANYTMEAFPAISWNKPHPYAGMREPCPSWSGSLDALATLIRQVVPGGAYSFMYADDKAVWKGKPHRAAARLFTADPQCEGFEGQHADVPALALLGAFARAMDTTPPLPAPLASEGGR